MPVPGRVLAARAGHDDRDRRVDVVLWDIKGKVAGLPVYQLLGGTARDGVLVYGYASGGDVAELLDDVAASTDRGYRAVRVRAAVPGLGQVYGVHEHGTAVYEPASTGRCRWRRSGRPDRTCGSCRG